MATPEEQALAAELQRREEQNAANAARKAEEAVRKAQEEADRKAQEEADRRAAKD